MLPFGGKISNVVEEDITKLQLYVSIFLSYNIIYNNLNLFPHHIP